MDFSSLSKLEHGFFWQTFADIIDDNNNSTTSPPPPETSSGLLLIPVEQYSSSYHVWSKHHQIQTRFRRESPQHTRVTLMVVVLFYLMTHPFIHSGRQVVFHPLFPDLTTHHHLITNPSLFRSDDRFFTLSHPAISVTSHSFIHSVSSDFDYL